MKKIASALALMALLTGLIGPAASAASYKTCPRSSCTKTSTHAHSGKNYAGHNNKDGHKHNSNHSNGSHH